MSIFRINNSSSFYFFRNGKCANVQKKSPFFFFFTFPLPFLHSSVVAVLPGVMFVWGTDIVALLPFPPTLSGPLEHYRSFTFSYPLSKALFTFKSWKKVNIKRQICWWHHNEVLNLLEDKRPLVEPPAEADGVVLPQTVIIRPTCVIQLSPNKCWVVCTCYCVRTLEQWTCLREKGVYWHIPGVYTPRPGSHSLAGSYPWYWIIS